MNQWTREELEASVDAYATMFYKEVRGEHTVKQETYKLLSERFGRSDKAFRRRFENISHVLLTMGLPWLPGLSPADHVGPTATESIRELITAKGYFSEFLGSPTADTTELERRTSELIKRGVPSLPLGTEQPVQILSQTVHFVRSPHVKAWVLEAAGGHCENCGLPAPFHKEDGLPFLEVHHIKWLSAGGSDRITNAIAVCPNCHRRFHHSADAQELVLDVLARIPRLKMEV